MSLIYFVRLIDWSSTRLCIWESFEDFQKGEDNWEYINGLVPFKAWLEAHGLDNIDIQYVGVSVDMVDTIDIVIK